jgi:hypothetical protein
MGLSPEYFWRLTWYDWGLYCLKHYKEQRRRENDHERERFLFGYLMATIGNFSMRKLNQPLTPDDFWPEGDMQASEDDLIELMSQPEVKYRFKKDG